MAQIINVDNYTRMVDMLKDFAGNTSVAYSDECQLRQIFIVNFINAFNNLDITDDNVSNNLNNYITEIIEYKIPIIDIYNYFQISTILLSDLDYFFSNYHSTFDNKKLLIHKIYLNLLGGNSTNENLANIINSSSNNNYPKIKNYIIPKIKYTYNVDENSQYFINNFKAIKAFYKIEIQSVLNKLLTDLHNQNDIRSFANELNTSYASKKFILFKYSNISKEYSKLNFINLTDTTKINSLDNIKNYIIKNINTAKIYDYFQILSSKIYESYIKDISEYQNRNKKFNVEEYIKNIDEPTYSIDMSNFDTYILDTYLYALGNHNIDKEILSINTYLSDIDIIRASIDGIINTIITTDNRFERGD